MVNLERKKYAYLRCKIIGISECIICSILIGAVLYVHFKVLNPDLATLAFILNAYAAQTFSSLILLVSIYKRDFLLIRAHLAIRLLVAFMNGGVFGCALCNLADLYDDQQSAYPRHSWQSASIFLSACLPISLVNIFLGHYFFFVTLICYRHLKRLRQNATTKD